MKPAFLLLCAIVFLTFPSDGLGFGHSAGLRSFAQNHHHSRDLQEDFGFSGTTPEQVCDSVLENWYIAGFPEKFDTRCTCEPKEGGGYLVSCSDYCEYCLPGACSRFSAAFELNSDLLVEKLQACDNFNVTSFNGETVCWKEDYTTSPSTANYFVDNQACVSTEFVDCPSVGFAVPQVDCSNLGYGMNMNFCAEETAVGSFEFLQAFYFLTIDDFTVGACSPPQCQNALDAAAWCTSTQLSESQALNCGSCVVGAHASITSTDPSTCAEANDIICAVINQCDDECLSCEGAVEEFTECVFEESIPIQCDFECSTSVLPADFGFSGTTPEQVCDSVLENWYIAGFPEKFDTRCTCEPKEGGGYSVSCSDYCEYCLPGACSRFSAAFELNSDLLVEKLQACDNFNVTSFNGETVCWKEDYTTSPSTANYFVDNQACVSTEFVDCPSLGFAVPQVDCSNLGYGTDMNFCAEETAVGSFEFLQAFYFLTIDDFTVGACSPPQCQNALDAAAWCTSTQLSESQALKCGSCVVGAHASITSTDPSTCAEANDIICAVINQCDDECLSCEVAVEEFTECVFEESIPIQCDFECSTS